MRTQTVSERAVHELLDAWPEAVFECSDGKIITPNKAAISLFKAENPEQFVGKALLDLVHGDDRRLLEPYLQKGAEGMPPFPFVEVRLVAIDGSLLNTEAAARITYLAGTDKLVAVIRDITGHKEEVREAQGRGAGMAKACGRTA